MNHIKFKQKIIKRFKGFEPFNLVVTNKWIKIELKCIKCGRTKKPFKNI